MLFRFGQVNKIFHYQLISMYSFMIITNIYKVFKILSLYHLGVTLAVKSMYHLEVGLGGKIKGERIVKVKHKIRNKWRRGRRQRRGAMWGQDEVEDGAIGNVAATKDIMVSDEFYFIWFRFKGRNGHFFPKRLIHFHIEQNSKLYIS